MEFNRKINTFLAKWVTGKNRKPLILRGARQTGKTSSLLSFGQKNFANVVYINLEKTEYRRLFLKEMSLTEFEKIINISLGKNLSDDKTFLFIDEIQEAPYLLKLLRFLFEERPRLATAAAGSLFEVKLKDENLSLPVGRIEFAYLYPLDFFEYLEALNEGNLLNFLRSFDFKEKIPEGIHEDLLRHFYEYTLVGGMPEAVKVYLQNKDLQAVNSVYSNLFTSFKDDVYKYASSANSKYITYVLDQAPFFAGTAITYEKFAESAYKSREISLAFDTLEKAMLLYQVKATKSTDLPLISNRKKPPKLIFLDVGLINFLMNIQSTYIGLSDLNNFYRGRIAEQIVAQNLLSSSNVFPPQLYYWYMKTGSQAELDFCLVRNGKMVGFEVKSGAAGKLRSAREFSEKTKAQKIIRVYSGQFQKQDNLISLPFYLLPRWQEVLDI